MRGFEVDHDTSGRPRRLRPHPGATSGCRHPLEAWRSLDLEDVGPDLAARIGRALVGRVLVCDGRWPWVLRGDAAAAVGVAVRFLHRHRPDCATGDLVMSAVLVHAAAGDAAAELVLAHGLLVLARHRTPARGGRWEASSAGAPSAFGT